CVLHGEPLGDELNDELGDELNDELCDELNDELGGETNRGDGDRGSSAPETRIDRRETICHGNASMRSATLSGGGFSSVLLRPVLAGLPSCFVRWDAGR
ncbi:MAG: hypothetical protein AAF907_14595, partial [Planctomycetota bacterium]